MPIFSKICFAAYEVDDATEELNNGVVDEKEEDKATEELENPPAGEEGT